MENKKILDVCCGGRMFWFNKKNPNVLYLDNRKAPKGHISTHPGHEVNPDIVMDFRDLKFPDKSFHLVVFDPPHFASMSQKGWLAKKYGVLNKETWQEDLKKGFDECWRVLKKNGVLIFKWSEEATGGSRSRPVNELIKLFGQDPLFGHKSGTRSNTHWISFMKF